MTWDSLLTVAMTRKLPNRHSVFPSVENPRPVTVTAVPPETNPLLGLAESISMEDVTSNLPGTETMSKLFTLTASDKFPAARVGLTHSTMLELTWRPFEELRNPNEQATTPAGKPSPLTVTVVAPWSEPRVGCILRAAYGETKSKSTLLCS